jgi:hypothetical protein
MRRARPLLALLAWMFLFLLSVPWATADDCSHCDCIHLPCPPECKPCCGLSKGRIVSKKDHTFVLRKDDGSLLEFKITNETSIPKGQISENNEATVYFRRSGADKLAQRVVVPEAAAK